MLLQPAAWLALAFAAATTTATVTTVITFGTTLTQQQQRRPRGYWYFAAGWMAIILCRAMPAMEYFYYDPTRLVAYVTGLATVFLQTEISAQEHQEVRVICWLDVLPSLRV